MYNMENGTNTSSVRDFLQNLELRQTVGSVPDSIRRHLSKYSNSATPQLTIRRDIPSLAL